MCKIAVAVALVVASSTCFADELYRQNPVNSFGGLSAQDARNPGGLGWFSEVVDNFEGVAGWTVTGIEFWGGYVTDVPGNTHGFMVRFYDGSAGNVGQLLLTQDVMTFTQTEYYSTTIGGLGTVRGYHYTLNLGTNFVVPGDGQYWMSVTAILDRGGSANEPQWGWVAATSVSQPSCRQWFFSPGNFTPQGSDVSFVLNGNLGGGPICNDIDINNDGSLFDPQDIEAFLSVFSEGPCIPDTATCDGIDFNNDGSIFDPCDIDSFLIVFSEGPCTPCGQ